MDSTHVFEPAYYNIPYSSRPVADGESGTFRSGGATSASTGGFFLSLLEFLPLYSAPRIVKAECFWDECGPARNAAAAGPGGKAENTGVAFPSGDAGLLTDLAV